MCRLCNRALFWTKDTRTMKCYYFNPFAPGNFAENHVLKLVEFFLTSVWLQMYKELKFSTKPFTGRALRGLLIQMQNFSLRSLGMHRKHNLEIDFFFSLSLLPFSFALLASFFFFCWALNRLHFGGKNFRESF